MFTRTDGIEIRKENIAQHEQTVVMFPRGEPLSAEREHIKAKILAKERQIAQLAGEIRWLRLELETV
jgi:hypothetical protein